MKISDCCGASPAGIEGAEEVGICPQCHEHCEWEDDEEEEAAPPPRTDLGWGNAWPAGTMPDEIKKCQALGHSPSESKMPCGGWLVVCATCNWEYRYASD